MLNKLKFSLISALLGSLLIGQIGSVLAAQSGNSPISSPISSPVTAPSPTPTPNQPQFIIWPVQYRFGPPLPSFISTPLFIDSWYQVQFHNDSSTTILNMKAFIASASSSVQVLDGEVSLGNIQKGQSAWSSDTFRLKINKSTAGRCDSVTWRVEYDDTTGIHHALNNIPQFLPGKAPGGCN